MSDLETYSNAPVHVVRIESGRHPFQVLLCVISLISGLSYFVFNLLGPKAAAPTSIQSTLPHWLITTWSALLIAGPGLTLAGTFWQSKTLGGIVTGLILQKRGLIVLGISTLIYAIAVIGYVQKTETATVVAVLFNVLLLAAFSLSCFLRWSHIRRDLRAIATTGTGYPNKNVVAGDE